MRELMFDKPGAEAGKLADAKAMRAMPTAAEAVLWAALRGRRLGWKFRRQHVIAGYIVDFYCAELWLAVEVDGAVHRRQRADDRERDEHLAWLGVRRLRLHNADVLERLGGVRVELTRHCEWIAASLGIPSPAPRGRARTRSM